MLVLPPGGACNFTEDLSVVGPLFKPEFTLWPKIIYSPLFKEEDPAMPGCCCCPKPGEY